MSMIIKKGVSEIIVLSQTGLEGEGMLDKIPALGFWEFFTFFEKSLFVFESRATTSLRGCCM